MSTWSPPYITVSDRHGDRVEWRLPDPLPWPAGASLDVALRTPVALGLPADGTIKVRWRTPQHPNPRSLTRPTGDQQTIALACDVLRAARSAGHGWDVDANGWPVQVRLAPERPVPERPAPPPSPAEDDAELSRPLLVGPGSAVSPANAILADIRAGRRQLGATVAQIIVAIRRQREISWSGAHKTNMNNVLDYLEQVMVYTEPDDDDEDETTSPDLPDVVAWMRARLALPGVQLGGSMHVALLLPPDLERVIHIRRYTDRRVERLNGQAVERYLAEWQRYESLMAARGTRPRGGKPPKRPADAPLLRAPQVPVAARTEELFATGLAMVLGYADQTGLLAGPSPWASFINRGNVKSGYRRSEHIHPHLRNVPSLGCLVDLGEAIARLGPIDPRTSRPVGERYRAVVLVSVLGLRPSETDALGPDDFKPGGTPKLYVSKSASEVHRLASPDGSTFVVRDRLKSRDPGIVRALDMPTYIADALSAHIAAGYASDVHLFTSPEGQPLRWSNAIQPFWRPAVTQVFGSSSSPLLREMPRRWLRKAAITWMLRAGLPVDQIAELTGHDVVTLYKHYAGVVAGHQDRHVWTSWDAAWDWAVMEHDVP